MYAADLLIQNPYHDDDDDDSIHIQNAENI